MGEEENESLVEVGGQPDAYGDDLIRERMEFLRREGLDL
jgi:hypothetical protein